MKVYVFGEILWDIFGEEKKIGGAPFNFAAHIRKLGAEPYIVSALGPDEQGRDAEKELENLSLSSRFVGISRHKTGYCSVTLKNGSPYYTLADDVAYDYIPYPALPDKCDALYFGTLAQRATTSATTLTRMLSTVKAKEVFFDVNIRQNFWNKRILESSLAKTTILKLSREDARVFGSSDLYALSLELSRRYPNLSLIIMTLDKDGAFVFDCKTKEVYCSEKPQSEVVSTVGAGDSFSACFLYNYLAGKEISVCLDRAVMYSDFVVTRLEAIPEIPDELIKTVTE